MPTPEDLFRQCVELAPDFCLRSEFRPEMGWNGEWDARASWTCADESPLEFSACGRTIVELLANCLSQLRHERAWLEKTRAQRA